MDLFVDNLMSYMVEDLPWLGCFPDLGSDLNDAPDGFTFGDSRVGRELFVEF